MYIIKEVMANAIKEKYKSTYISKVSGLTEGYISQIFNGRKCRKQTAYIIAKTVDSEYEIEDVFNFVEE